MRAPRLRPHARLRPARPHRSCATPRPRRGNTPRASSSKLDDEYGRLIRERAHDAGSLGVAHQARARELADQFGYVEPHLWTGIGRARSGCGAALVGSADQVLCEIEAYRKMGIRAFIFSGYPHLDEARAFGSQGAAAA